MCAMGKWIFRDGEEWVDKHKAAELLGCDERTIDRLRERGQLQTYLLRGWYVRLSRAEVMRLQAPQGPVVKRKEQSS